MVKKFKPGSVVFIKPSGVPVTVTRYCMPHRMEGDGEALVSVTWKTITGKTITALLQEKMLTALPGVNTDKNLN